MCLETLMKAKAKSAKFQKTFSTVFFIYILLYLFLKTFDDLFPSLTFNTIKTVLIIMLLIVPDISNQN